VNLPFQKFFACFRRSHAGLVSQIMHAITTLDLTDDETRALVAQLKHAIEY